MLELVFLGTSASAPSVRRGLPAMLVLHRERRFLVDVGEGTQRQILRSGLGFRKIETVLLTHGHLDHMLGLGGLVSTFARWEASAGLAIFGGRWALERVRDLMAVVFRGGEVELDVTYHPVEAGPVITLPDLEVVAFPVQHRGGGNFGYLFQERSRRPFLQSAAADLGVPEGPERRQLVQGKTVTLPGGRVVRPDDVLGPTERGTKLVVIGDAARTDGLDRVAREADALVCESTYVTEDRETARQFGHLTAREAAELAREAGVHALLLTHVSRRYGSREILEDARSVFPSAILAEDLDRFAVRRGELRRLEHRP